METMITYAKRRGRNEKEMESLTMDRRECEAPTSLVEGKEEREVLNCKLYGIPKTMCQKLRVSCNMSCSHKSREQRQRNTLIFVLMSLDTHKTSIYVVNKHIQRDLLYLCL